MNTLSSRKIKFIYELAILDTVNIRGIAQNLDISRNTVRRYLSQISMFKILYPERINDFYFFMDKPKKPSIKGERFDYLQIRFGDIFQNMKRNNSTILMEWTKYKFETPSGYKYSQFCIYFKDWLNRNGVANPRNLWKISEIAVDDFKVLKKWRRCSNRLKWSKAVALLDAYKGLSIKNIASKIECSTDKVKEWIKFYRDKGLAGVTKKPRKSNENILQFITVKKENLIKILHESPRLHEINRASWSLITLAKAFEKKHKTSISVSTISEYIKKLGYSFKKAKETLTSPDPNFREKLENITKILSNLKPNQKFFSVDEFGPFAVKTKGGRSLVKNGETKSYPQMQRSKGCIICTAALELSENQMTHFYSLKKNSDEMIRLLEVLLVKYKAQEKIFFSWDAASWHGSKKLYKKIEEVNSSKYRLLNETPLVELAPLPSSAQFLNVIESVFSGLAKAIIHNSDYASADECKSAIDNYFNDRNVHFKEYPKKAGNKIWGKELVIPVFDETKNCKDPKWR